MKEPQGAIEAPGPWPEDVDVPRGKRPVQWLLWGFLCFAAFVLVDMVGTVLQGARPIADRAVCTGNLKQLALGDVMYAEDHDDRFPLTDWMDSTNAYLKSDGYYHCPEVLKTNPGGFGYSMMRSEVGARTDEKADQKIALFFESTDLARNSVGTLSLMPHPGRHDGVNNIAYADGHAKGVRTPPAGAKE